MPNQQPTEDDLIKLIQKLPTAELSSQRDQQIRAELGLVTPSIFNFLNPFTMRKLASGVLTLAVVFGVGTYAYSADTVTRGTTLYPIKQGIESILLSPSGDPANQVVTYLQLADRRLAEAEVLAANNGTTVAFEFNLIQKAYAIAPAPPIVDPVPTTATSPAVPVAAVDPVPAVAVNLIPAVVDPFILATPSPLEATLADMTIATEGAIEAAEDIADPVTTQTALTKIAITQTTQVETLTKAVTQVDPVGAAVITDTVIQVEENQTELEVAAERVAEAVLTKSDTVVIDIETNRDIEAELLASGDVANDDIKNSDDGDTEDKKTAEEKALAEIDKARTKVEELKSELNGLGVDAADVFNKAQVKLGAAEAAFIGGNYGKARGLAKAAESMMKIKKTVFEDTLEAADNELENDTKDSEQDSNDKEEPKEQKEPKDQPEAKENEQDITDNEQNDSGENNNDDKQNSDKQDDDQKDLDTNNQDDQNSDDEDQKNSDDNITVVPVATEPVVDTVAPTDNVVETATAPVVDTATTSVTTTNPDKVDNNQTDEDTSQDNGKQDSDKKNNSNSSSDNDQNNDEDNN